MSAAETKNIDKLSIKKIGIIAGSGSLPKKLAQSCKAKGITPFIVAFEGQTSVDTVKDNEHIWTSLGSAGKIMKALKAHDVSDLVLIGSIRRPSLSELRPDIKGAEILARIGLRSLGDNDLLELLKDELHKEGFTVHAVQGFVSDLLTPKGILGKIKPSSRYDDTIKRGLSISKEIGRLDVGQAVVVQQDLIIGVEGIEGTDELVRRCRGYLRNGEGGILVKTAKPQQDKSLDLPTIGPDTVINAAENGIVGIVVEAGNSLLIDADLVVEIADQNKIFVIGVDIGDYF